MPPFPDLLAMAEVADATTLIKDYSSFEQQLVSLQNCEKQIEDTDCRVAQALLEISLRQTLLKQTQEDVSSKQTRLHRNENPRFLHYFVWKREAKVERLKGETHELKIIEQDQSNQLSIASAQLPGLQQKQQDARIIVDRKHEMEGRCRQLFNKVVAGQSPTQTLQHLRIRKQEQGSLLGSEQVLLQAVSNSVKQLEQGLLLFQQAEGLYQEAQCTNEHLKSVRRKSRNETGRCTEVEAAMNSQSLKRQIRDLKCQRDEAIKEANGVVILAYEVTSNGLATFPSKARARYPELCTSIGEVAFPRVQGANFTGSLVANSIFGSAGAAVNDAASGCQIRDNVQVAGQCASITVQQLWLMMSMQSVVATNVYKLEASVQKIKKNIVAEHHQTFNCKRSAVWWSSLEQHWFSGPADHRELRFKKLCDSVGCMTDAYMKMMQDKKKSAVMDSPRCAVLDLSCLIC